MGRDIRREVESGRPEVAVVGRLGVVTMRRHVEDGILLVVKLGIIPANAKAIIVLVRGITGVLEGDMCLLEEQ